jgi:hypothetical protein
MPLIIKRLNDTFEEPAEKPVQAKWLLVCVLTCMYHKMFAIFSTRQHVSRTLFNSFNVSTVTPRNSSSFTHHMFFSELSCVVAIIITTTTHPSYSRYDIRRLESRIVSIFRRHRRKSLLAIIIVTVSRTYLIISSLQ